MRNVTWVFAFATLALLALNPAVEAASVTDTNLLVGSGVNASPEYFGNPATRLNDQLNTSFVFADGGGQYSYVNFNGLNTAITDLRFFDANWGPRSASAVAVYYSSSASETSLSPGSYTLLGSYSLATTNDNPNNIYYLTPTAPADSYDNPPGAPIRYQDVPVSIPSGTGSLLLQFTNQFYGSNYVGSALSEIQAFNSLTPTVTVSTLDQNTMPAISSTDLINQATVSFATQTPTAGTAGEYGTFGGLNDGLAGTPSDLNNAVVASQGTDITFTLTQPYNIESFVSTSAWTDTGRSQQHYTLSYSTDGVTFNPIYQVAEIFNDIANQVSLTGASGFLAMNAIAVRVHIDNYGSGDNNTVYREFDLYGVPVPEPSALLLSAWTIPVLFRVRRK